MREADFVIGRRTSRRRRRRTGSWPRRCFHSSAAWFSTRYSSFMATSSLGKCPRVRTAQLGVQRLYGVRGVVDPPHAFGIGKEWDDVLPVAPPALRDRRISLPLVAGFEVLKGLHAASASLAR